MKNREDLRILLLQIRQDSVVRQEEVASFCRYANLSSVQIDVFNVFDHPTFDQKILANYDALFIGGASEASVLKPDQFPFIQPSIDLVQACVESSFPTFASCFGFQLAILAFGGEIIRDESDFEMGTIPIELTEAAKRDPVYQGIPNHFKAVSVHQEKCLQLPGNCQLLAYTNSCTHSFKVVDRPFWAFQFHPELDRPTLTERLGVYRDQYTEDAEHFNAIFDGLEETPDSNLLLENFVDRVLLKS